MNKMRSILIVAIALVLVFGAVAQAEKKEFKMGVLQWNCEMLPSQVVIDVLEERFGYKITPVEMFEWGIAYAALAKGDINVVTTEINYCQHDYWTRTKDKVEKISAIWHGLYQGFGVPTYVPINSIEELNDHKDKFGGKVVGIEPGSGLMRQSHQVVRDYNLDFKLLDGSTAAMLASLKSAYDKKKWIVVTIWDPMWAWMMWDLKFLEDPKKVQEPPQTCYIISSRDFTKEYPFASEIMRGIFIPKCEINKMLAWVKEGKTIKEAAKKWEEQNRDLIDRWCVIGEK